MRLLNTKQTLTFANPKGGPAVTVPPQPGIQEVPDWLRKSTTFEVALDKGIIVDLDNLKAARKVAVDDSVEQAPKSTGKTSKAA